MNAPLLTLEEFSLFLDAKNRRHQLLFDINFAVFRKEIVGLIGESGSGKSLTVQSILKLLGPGFKTAGRINFAGRNLLEQSDKSLRQVRGSEIGLISQDPYAALNPTLKIKTQLLESLFKDNPGLSQKEAIKIAVYWLERMRITKPAVRLSQYPHELSGGMRQRICLAMALISRPALLLADEPTTALDVTVQAEILILFKELLKEHALGILLITHDLGVAANCCDRILVMRDGRIVEAGSVDEIFNNPRHDYTRSLLQAKLRLIGKIK